MKLKLLVMAPAILVVGGGIRGFLATVLVSAALAPDAQRVPRGLILILAHHPAHHVPKDSTKHCRAKTIATHHVPRDTTKHCRAKTIAMRRVPREHILRLVHHHAQSLR